MKHQVQIEKNIDNKIVKNLEEKWKMHQLSSKGRQIPKFQLYHFHWARPKPILESLCNLTVARMSLC